MIRRPLTARFWIRLSTLVAVTSVGLALAHLTWRLTGWDDGRSTIETPDRLPPVGGGDRGLAAILALAPFGGGAGVGASGLPPTSLGLVLKGVILAATPEASTALIAVGEAAPRNFSIGEAPVGSAVIEGIELDVVVLNVGGRREALTFPRLAGASAAAPATPAAPIPTQAPPSPEAAAALAAASPIATALAASGGTGSSGPASRAPAIAAPANTAAALQSAGVSATSDGYRLGPDAPAQLLRAGLRPGDLIRSLNGRPVGDLASDQQLFERAAAAGSARVEIVRDGRTLTLTFPLR